MVLHQTLRLGERILAQFLGPTLKYILAVPKGINARRNEAVECKSYREAIAFAMLVGSILVHTDGNLPPSLGL
jgi:hypothetical protein